MHILIAPDSYKGSLTARQVCDILAQALLTHPGVTVATLPLSDGGEGFGTCCVDACKGDILYTMPLTYMAIQYKHPFTPGAIRR